MRWLRRYSDQVGAYLATAALDEATAVIFLEQIKRRILNRFPGKETVYAMIYERRFRRILLNRGLALPFPTESDELN